MRFFTHLVPANRASAKEGSLLLCVSNSEFEININNKLGYIHALSIVKT
jgi:hypothetical protein